MGTQNNKIILGIDPYNHHGIWLAEGSGQPVFDARHGVLDLRKLPNHYEKLARIFNRTLSLIDEFLPDEMAIGSFYGKNVQSMLKLGRAQGVAMSAALYRKIPITEYAP